MGLSDLLFRVVKERNKERGTLPISGSYITTLFPVADV